MSKTHSGFAVCRDAAGGDRGGAKLFWRSVGAVRARGGDLCRGAEDSPDWDCPFRKGDGRAGRLLGQPLHPGSGRGGGGVRGDLRLSVPGKVGRQRRGGAAQRGVAAAGAEGADPLSHRLPLSPAHPAKSAGGDRKQKPPAQPEARDPLPQNHPRKAAGLPLLSGRDGSRGREGGLCHPL